MKQDDHPPFNGVLIVDDETFDRIEADLKNPTGPTEAILRGAEFLRNWDRRRKVAPTLAPRRPA